MTAGGGMRRAASRGPGKRAVPVATVDPAWGGARAWRYLRWHPGYRTEWRSLAVEAARERAPFPVRVQSEADLAAARWGLFAWQVLFF